MMPSASSRTESGRRTTNKIRAFFRAPASCSASRTTPWSSRTAAITCIPTLAASPTPSIISASCPEAARCPTPSSTTATGKSIPAILSRGDSTQSLRMGARRTFRFAGTLPLPRTDCVKRARLRAMIPGRTLARITASRDQAATLSRLKPWVQTRRISAWS